MAVGGEEREYTVEAIFHVGDEVLCVFLACGELVTLAEREVGVSELESESLLDQR